MQSHKSTCAVIISGIFWGIISIFINKLSKAGLNSLQISSVRMLVAAISFSIFLAIRSPYLFKIKLRDIWMFIGTGIISVVLFNCCYFYTMIHSQASIAVVLLYTSPVFVVLLSALLFRERITKRKLLALIMSFAGCILVSGIVGGGYKLKPLLLLTGIGSGFFYALYTIFGRFALKKYDTLTVTVYTFIFGVIGSVPISGIKPIIKTISASPSIIFWCIGIGIICTALPYFFYTWGLQRMESGRAAILAAVEPLVGAVIGIVRFHESHGIFKLAGIALILATVIFLNVADKRNNSSITNSGNT